MRQRITRWLVVIFGREWRGKAVARYVAADKKRVHPNEVATDELIA
jgi:hypothetical protein